MLPKSFAILLTLLFAFVNNCAQTGNTGQDDPSTRSTNPSEISGGTGTSDNDPGESSPYTSPSDIRDGAMISAATSDSEGNLYVIGNFTGWFDFQPGDGETRIRSFVEHQQFLAKYNADNTIEWLHLVEPYREEYNPDGSYRGSYSMGYMDMLIAGNGNLLLTGSFRGECDLDPTDGVDEFTSFGTTWTEESHYNRDNFNPYQYNAMFIQSLTPDGDYNWSRKFGGPGQIHSIMQARATDGNILIHGMHDIYTNFVPDPDPRFNDITDLPRFNTPRPAEVSYADQDQYMVVYDPDGNILQAVTWIDDPGFSAGGLRVVTTNDDSIILCSAISYAYDLDPGPGEVITVSITDMTDYRPDTQFCIAKLRPDLTFEWHDIWSPGSSGYLNTVTTDSAGNLYISGSFYTYPKTDGKLSIASMDYPSWCFLLKYSSDGTREWLQVFGETEDVPNVETGVMWVALSINDEGNIELKGTFNSPVDFDPGNGELILSPEDETSRFIATYNPDGEFLGADLSETSPYGGGIHGIPNEMRSSDLETYR